MKSGIVTRAYIEDGIPQPYDAGKLTKESLEMVQERRIAETEKNKKSEKEVNKEGAKISIKEKLENYKEEIAKKNTEITKQKNYNNELQFDCFLHQGLEFVFDLEGNEVFKDFDMAVYSKMNFGMYSGCKEKVKIEFKAFMDLR